MTAKPHVVKEIDPQPSECWPNAPYFDADIHEGATFVEKRIAKDHQDLVDGYEFEHWRCSDCGLEWDV